MEAALSGSSAERGCRGTLAGFLKSQRNLAGHHEGTARGRRLCVCAHETPSEEGRRQLIHASISQRAAMLPLPALLLASYAFVASPGLPASPVHSATFRHRPTLSATAATEQAAPTTVVDAAALCAGTSIGGGFLALPSVSAAMGFLPAATAMVGIWALLFVSALAYAEGACRVLAGRETKVLVSPNARGEDDTSRVSIASLSEAAFGSRSSSFCTIAFIFQVLAMITAQLIKTAESSLPAHSNPLTTPRTCRGSPSIRLAHRPLVMDSCPCSHRRCRAFRRRMLCSGSRLWSAHAARSTTLCRARQYIPDRCHPRRLWSALPQCHLWRWPYGCTPSGQCTLVSALAERVRRVGAARFPLGSPIRRGSAGHSAKHEGQPRAYERTQDASRPRNWGRAASVAWAALDRRHSLRAASRGSRRCGGGPSAGIAPRPAGHCAARPDALCRRDRHHSDWRVPHARSALSRHPLATPRHTRRRWRSRWTSDAGARRPFALLASARSVGVRHVWSRSLKIVSPCVLPCLSPSFPSLSC